MGLAVALSRAQLGIEAPLVQVEVHTGAGLPLSVRALWLSRRGRHVPLA